MCLIAFAWLAHPRWKLVLAGNRDEFHDRPAKSANWWPDAPGIFGGRDLQAGGSWLAIDRGGRLAAVTNFREPGVPPGPRSRGELVADFLGSQASIGEWADEVASRPGQWSGFNLLLFDLKPVTPRAAPREAPARAVYLSNRIAGGPVRIEAGVHGLSNELLDCGWPKVSRVRERLNDALREGGIERPMFDALADATPAPDAALPATGLALDRERLLSAAMIRSEGYGTRASTLVLVDHEGQVTFVERSWPASGQLPSREVRASFRLGVPAHLAGA